MDLPLNIQMNGISPSTKKVFLFKDKTHSADAPKHYYICIPLKDDKFLLLVMFSRSCEKIKNYYDLIDNAAYVNNPKKCLNSLLFFNEKSGLNFIKEKSVIDCNKPKYGTREEIQNDIAGNIVILTTSIEDRIYMEILEAIKESPLVKKFIKKNLADIKDED